MLLSAGRHLRRYQTVGGAAYGNNCVGIVVVEEGLRSLCSHIKAQEQRAGAFRRHLLQCLTTQKLKYVGDYARNEAAIQASTF